jgi:hypothetical protein
MYQEMSNKYDVETHLVHCVTVEKIYNIYIYIIFFTNIYIYINIYTQHDKHTHTHAATDMSHIIFR